MTDLEVSRLMNNVWFVCSAANALTSPGVTFGAMKAIIDDLRQKLEDEKHDSVSGS